MRRLYGTRRSRSGRRAPFPCKQWHVVRRGPVPSRAWQPTRIDLLELDIDLRLTDLWREAAEISEWNLEVVSAFMRAAYGKGYCDALTEDAPGSLCLEHGYEVPRGASETPPRRDRARETGVRLRSAQRPLDCLAWHGRLLLPGS